jgi:hypothetical protein
MAPNSLILGKRRQIRHLDFSTATAVNRRVASSSLARGAILISAHVGFRRLLQDQFPPVFVAQVAQLRKSQAPRSLTPFPPPHFVFFQRAPRPVRFVVLSHERRRVVHFGVTEHPTQEWTMQQISPTRSSVGTAELSPGIGPGNRAVFPEGQKLRRT